MSYKKFSNMEDFIIRSYTKKELALMFFPRAILVLPSIT